ncbi:MAG TPA: hypothetical protein VGK20_12015 [Candidatus Binatia bacterium]|jgi:hypothetical protein
MGLPTSFNDLAPLARAAVIAAACLAALGFPGRAQAANCGDDVGGERVACSCGDIVVSDTVIWATDPVAVEPCTDDGLIIQVPPGSDGVTLNLGGQSLAGHGHGAGIFVARGGRLGSTIIGGDAGDTRAEIANFAIGIRASGHAALRAIRGLDVHHNRFDGLNVRVSGIQIEDVHSQDNGRGGATVSGHDIQIHGVVANNNSRDGLSVHASGAQIQAETNENGRNGTRISGRGNVLSSSHSSMNGGLGVVATGAGHQVNGLESTGNGRSGIGGQPGAVQ